MYKGFGALHLDIVDLTAKDRRCGKREVDINVMDKYFGALHLGIVDLSAKDNDWK